MTPHNREELLELLEALCEERLTPSQHARLDQLVVSNREARRLYIDYVTLHGTLAWDVATAAGEEFPAHRDAAAADEPRRRPNVRRRIMVFSSVAAAVIAVIVTWNLLPPKPAEQSTDEPLVAIDPAPVDVAAQPVPHVAPIEDSLQNPVDDPGSEQPPSLPMVVAQRPDDAVPIDVPVVADTVSSINTAMIAAWNEAGIRPSEPADDAEWVRRLYLDLAGRIPSPGEADSFLTDSSADKRERLVDSLLQSPETARNFATQWTNLLVGRAERPGLDRVALQQYLQSQFSANRPWSESVTALITAEGPAEGNGPANFLLAHLNNEAVPATAVTARCFLGLQVQCTQCHAHPFYKGWGQEQFWELNSFFQQTKVARSRSSDGGMMTLELTNSVVGGPTFYENRNGEMKVAFPRFNEVEVDPGTATNRRQELAQLLVSGDRPQLARAFVNRTWAHFFRFGFVNPIDDMGPHNPATHPELLDRLADDFVAGGYDIRALCRAICNSTPYQLTSRPGDASVLDDPEQGDPPLFSRMYLKHLTAEQLYDSLQVATLPSADPGAALRNADAQRQAWIAQFFSPEQTEENCESTTFDGTLPQALSMMNGELVAQAVSSADNTRLASILVETPDEVERIRKISLATLSRYPTRDEVDKIREFLRHSVRQQVQSGRVANAKQAIDESLRDVYWAYLNSAEFIVNH
ncbi:MAG: DUF1553 domain-containing protein [Planctomycetaceae bacterium]|nr:DUF1553 domain-containing protein [Planctomycetaceae bacterium]